MFVQKIALASIYLWGLTSQTPSTSMQHNIFMEFTTLYITSNVNLA